MRWLIILFFAFYVNQAFTQDRTLEDFLTAAHQNSPVVKGLENQVEALRIDSQLLKAALGPQVNFISTNSYAPIIHGYGYDEAITNIAQISGLIQASRNFLSRRNIAVQYRSIILQKQSLLDTMLLSRQDLIRTVTDQYITAYGDLLSFNFNKDIYDLMKREEATLRKLAQANVYKQTDFLSFYVTLQQQELTYLQSEIQYNADFLTLNFLCGITDTTIRKISMPKLADTSDIHYIESIFYKRFVTDSLRLVNEKELIHYQYKPRIAAFSDAGYNSSMQYLPYRNVGVSAGLSVIIPIYDGRQQQMKKSQVDLLERTRQTNREFFINQFRIQFQQLKQQLRSVEGMTNKITNQIAYSRTLIEANEKLLNTGDVTMKDYITSITSYLNAQNLLTVNNISRLRILNLISYWNAKP